MNERTVFPDQMDARRAAVWDKLSVVTDPELDESVTEMAFVADVGIRNGDEVHVTFRLPTYWCSPNFAYMMAQDMRAAVLGLDWVRTAHVVLGEHMYVEKINHGVNNGLSFEDAFGDEASGNLGDLRQTFLRKAFQWRQEALLTHMLSAGATAADVLQLTVKRLHECAVTMEARELIARYLDRRAVAGAFDQTSPAFVTLEGQAIAAGGLSDYLRAIRRIRTNAEFNGALCRRLLVERFSTDPLESRNDRRPHAETEDAHV